MRGLFVLLACVVIFRVFFKQTPFSRSARATASAPDANPPPDNASQPYLPQGEEHSGIALDILIDNSGSMKDRAGSDAQPKYVVAKAAIGRMLDATDSAVARQPDVPVKVAMHTFSSDVSLVLPMQPYNRDSVRAALERIPTPNGSTAIGRAMSEARLELYRSGMLRKNLIVVTDGQNTTGPDPESVAHEIFDRSQGAVHMYFVAFDARASLFSFLPSVKGAVLEARDGATLGLALNDLYTNKVLAEAVDTTALTPRRAPDTNTVRRDPAAPMSPPTRKPFR
ncbi:MAG: vWA domain-containing protein [Gemmatimonadaceae bacterium]